MPGRRRRSSSSLFHFEEDEAVEEEEGKEEERSDLRSTIKERRSSSFLVPNPESLSLKEDYHSSASYQRAVGDFEECFIIGTGSFGDVYLVKDRYTGKLFAKKTIKKMRLMGNKKDLQNSRNERDILAKISHPSIVKLFYALHDNEDINFILEYIPGGELFKHLLDSPGHCFAESKAKFYLAQIADALHHLHTMDVVYRDLKPENCLLDARGHVVLTDFGLSSMDSKCHSLKGTPEFTAPEVFQGDEYSFKADWWSFGVMMYDMLKGYTPYKGNSLEKVRASQGKKVDYSHLSEYAVLILRRLLQKNPSKRMDVDEEFVKFRRYRFFKDINWIDIRSNVPPFTPTITDLALAENFDLETIQREMQSKQAKQETKRALQSINEDDEDTYGIGIPINGNNDIDQSIFKGFSYTASHSVLERHMV